MNCPHCKVHVNEHPASRCFDAWVAEDVMEWKPYFIVSYNILYPPGRQSFCDERPGLYRDYRPDKPYEFDSEHFYNSSENPPFTQPIVVSYGTSISAAFDVAWKIIDPSEDEFEVHFIDGWIATFRIVGRGIHASMDPFFPSLAICRAALITCLEDK